MSTLGSANQAPKAVVKLSSLQPRSAGVKRTIGWQWGTHVPSLGTDQVPQRQPPLVAAANMRLSFKHQLRVVCPGICRAFPQSQESHISLEHLLQLSGARWGGSTQLDWAGTDRTGSGVGPAPLCQGGGGGSLPWASHPSFATLGCFAALPLKCCALC